MDRLIWIEQKRKQVLFVETTILYLRGFGGIRDLRWSIKEQEKVETTTYVFHFSS
jgi:hypothetical protein